jgi:small subunit ribosomal protein S20
MGFTLRALLRGVCLCWGHRIETAVGVRRGLSQRQPRFITLQEVTFMANTKSAKKAIRKTIAKTAVNKARRSRMRTYVRKVEEAIASGDKSVAEQALRSAQPEMMRSAQKGVLHRNTASRKISRLSANVRAMGA